MNDTFFLFFQAKITNCEPIKNCRLSESHFPTLGIIKMIHANPCTVFLVDHKSPKFVVLKTRLTPVVFHLFFIRLHSESGKVLYFLPTVIVMKSTTINNDFTYKSMASISSSNDLNYIQDHLKS